jgi:glycolate oxidase iron-sulfur subunit
MEQSRAGLRARRPASVSRRLAEWCAYRLLLPRHWLLVAITWLLLVAQRLHVVPKRAGLPRLRARSLRRLEMDSAGIATGAEPNAWLFTGCVMDAWMRDTHRATATVMRAAGATIARPGPTGACCGALHVHAGRIDEARRLGRRVITSMPGDAPVVVNSAGCGAAMKEYGELLGTPEARAFAARVEDFSEWLARVGPPALRAQAKTVVVQDPCHLRHVQRAHTSVRAVLQGAYDVRETDDDGLCCGAGGAYSVLQPDLSFAIRDRKVAALERAGAGAPDAVIASANPGCIMHLRAAGLDVRHPADLLAEALNE